MDKLAVFEVILSQPQGVYFAGQHVEGQCVVQLHQEITIKGIRLRLEGKSSVHWTDPYSPCDGGNWTEPANAQKMRAGARVETALHFYSSEQYFSHELLLCGEKSKKSNQTLTLNAGHYSFPFCVRLPESLPPSFEGDHGHVRYTIRAVIDKPWKFDHVSKTVFTVIGLLDLNHDTPAQAPAEGEEEAMLCCLCCTSGPISVNFSLQRRGFVPGEPVLWAIRIHNNSRKRILKSVVNLEMVTTFYANKKSNWALRGGKRIGTSYGHTCRESRTLHREVGEVRYGAVDSGDNVLLENQDFVIPPVPPSYLRGCKIIYVKYILKLTVYTAEPGLEIEVPLELIVGTVPLCQQPLTSLPHPSPSLRPPPHHSRHSPSHPHPLHPSPSHPSPCKAGYGVSNPECVDRPHGGVTALGDASDAAAPYAAPYTSPHDLPPPTYSECMFGKVSVREGDDSEHTRGSLHYTPLYPYWGHHRMTPSAPMVSSTAFGSHLPSNFV